MSRSSALLALLRLNALRSFLASLLNGPSTFVGAADRAEWQVPSMSADQWGDPLPDIRIEIVQDEDVIHLIGQAVEHRFISCDARRRETTLSL